MKPSRAGPWIAIVIGSLYFFVPLIATFEFSLRMRRGAYSFDAYEVVLGDPRFQATFGYSTALALATIAFGVLLVVPTAYWVQLRLPRLRPIVEFLTLLPLVVPSIVLVFGYLRIYGSSSILPMTGNERATDLLLMFSYVMLSLPYMYRAVDTGHAIDRHRHLDRGGRKPRRQLGDDPSQGHLPECAGRDPERRLPDLCHRHR